MPQRMPKIWQEIHCTISGGGCGGFILVKLDVSINRRITLVCPKCKHEHLRVVKDGQIVETGRFNGESEEELCPTIAAWSEEPRTVCMREVVEQHNYKKERDGVVIKNNKDLIRPPYDTAELLVRESWTDRFLGRLAGR